MPALARYNTVLMSTQSKPVVSQASISVGPLFSSLFAWCSITLLAVLAIGELKPQKPIGATAPAGEFSAERAMFHVRTIARIPHPIGSAANETVKQYLIAQLSNLGLNPQVFSAIGIHQSNRNIVAGDTHDVIGRLPGTASSRAMLLMAHYDSVDRSPGAGDDGAGVAAILEALRALRSGPALKNDLVVLFTDGEEAGLLGAEAFANSHSWMKDVGLVLNFEARGDKGASLLFETSTNNRPLIEAVARATPHPTGSSLFYALYKLLPNDTDFTVFRPYRTPGLNFAFGEYLEAYHARLDRAENLSLASLQHHGSYALSLTGYFGQMDLTPLRAQTSDDIFFNWFGSSLFIYPQTWVLPGEIAATVPLILAMLLSVRKAETRISRILLALLPCTVVLVAVPLVMSVAGWLLLHLLAGHMIVSDSPANSWLLAGLALLGACAGDLLLVGFRRRFSIQEFSFAGLLIICILSWAIALMLPAGSYVLFWPLLAMSLGLLALELMTKTGSAHAQWVAGLVGTIITVLLFAPIAYLLYIFLTFQLISIAAVGLLLGLFFVACIPLLNIAVSRSQWRPAAVLLLICSIASLVAGAEQSRYSGQHPRRDTIVYTLNADDHSAVWISYDRSLDGWTSQFITNGQRKPQPMPNYLAGFQRPVLSGSAPLLELPPPIAEIKSSELLGNLRKVRMNVSSPRNAGRIYLDFDKEIQPISIRIAGREVVPTQNSRGLTISLVGAFPDGAELELAFQGPVRRSLLDHGSILRLAGSPNPQPSARLHGGRRQ